MRTLTTRRTGLVAAAALTAVVLAGCSTGANPAEPGGAPADLDPTADVTIVVGEMPSADQEASLETFKKKVDAFEKKYPNIKIKGDETRYDTSTFNAMLVGGTLPITMAVPFTDIGVLIERGQAADISAYAKEDPVVKQLNPDLAGITQDKDGKIFGIVREAYTMGLLYNRSLYTAAGLDPNTVPTTWEEVLTNAKAITEKTGKTGFVIPTVNNVGGWMLTTMSYSNGSLIEKTDGDKSTITVDSEGMKKTLQFLKDLRWKDNAAGANFLLNGDDIRNDFAGGSVAQTVNGATLYGDLVVNRGMNKEDIGIAPLPQGAKGLGTLGGGAVQWFNPKATPNEIAAAIKFSTYYYLNTGLDEEAAVTWAKARSEDKRPVGVPEVPLFGDAAYEKYLGWIKPYTDVNREYYTDYLESIKTLPIVPEPARSAQELYAALDPIAQAVLTREDANIDELLSTAQKQMQAIVDAAS